MTTQSKALRRNVTPIFMTAIGSIFLLLGLGVAYFPSRPSPGRLVATQNELVWRGTPGTDASNMYAVGEFKVVNTGRTPVRIVEATSSCGCATPTISTTLVQPNAQATIQVQATIPDGAERVVTVKIGTDSVLTPELLLKMRIVSTRRPPFLMKAAGDISFMGEYSLSDSREIVAVTVVPIGGAREPIVRNEIPFLKVGPPTINEKIFSDQNIIQIEYTYKIGLSTKTPDGLFSGEVTVTDPWDANRVERIGVTLETPAPLRVIPSRLVVRREGGGTRETIFIVRSRTPMTKPSVVDLGGEKTPFVVELLGMSSDNRTATYKIVFARDTAEDSGERQLLIRPDGDASEGVKLPVKLMPEGQT